MGWNNLEIYKTNHPILKNISELEQFYFVHSYYLNTFKKDQILADTNYNQKSLPWKNTYRCSISSRKK